MDAAGLDAVAGSRLVAAHHVPPRGRLSLCHRCGTVALTGCPLADTPCLAPAVYQPLRLQLQLMPHGAVRACWMALKISTHYVLTDLRQSQVERT